MKHSELIEALGGGTKVAEKLSAISGESVDREAIYKWRERDFIPWRWRPLLLPMAKEMGVAIPADFLPGVMAA